MRAGMWDAGHGFGEEKVSQIIKGLRSQAEEPKLVAPCHCKDSRRAVLGSLSRRQKAPSLGSQYS